MHADQYQRHCAASLGAAEAPRWLRVKSAAAYLGIGSGTLNKLRVYGGGPRYAKLGHTVVYDPSDLDDWANERKVRSTSERVRVA
ncbi:MAG: helix-turn-helix transcriptional regulator [Geminicoccaceae bacterium]